MRDAPTSRYRKTVRPFNGSFGKNSVAVGVSSRHGTRVTLRSCSTGALAGEVSDGAAEGRSAIRRSRSSARRERRLLNPPRMARKSGPSGLRTIVTEGTRGRFLRLREVDHGPAYACVLERTSSEPESTCTLLRACARRALRAAPFSLRTARGDGRGPRLSRGQGRACDSTALRVRRSRGRARGRSRRGDARGGSLGTDRRQRR